MSAENKVPVTERALIQRLNRKLKTQHRKLCTARYSRDGEHLHENSNLGRYYVVDTYQNTLVDSRVNLETFARQEGVLAAWEDLTEHQQS